MQEKQKFDFGGAMSNLTEIEARKKELKEKKRNTNIAVAGVALVAIAGTAYGIKSSIENSRAEIDSKIAQAQKQNSSIEGSIAWLEKQESKMRADKNATEQMMNAAIAQKVNTVQLLGAEREVSVLYKKLNQAHIKDAKEIQLLIADLKAVQAIVDNKNSSYDQKESILASDAFKNWDKVSQMQKEDKFVTNNLNKVKTEYSNFMSEVVTFEKQYVQVIKEVIASGNYSLNQTQAEVMRNIQAESESVRGEFAEVHKEIGESAKALAQEGKEVGNLANEFTQRDLDEANSAIKDMENAALQKAMEDKKTVEAMIASINNGQSVESALGMTGQEPVATPVSTTTTTTSSSGGSSLMPFMMGMWLGNAFSSSPSYNNYSSNNYSSNDKNRQNATGAGSTAKSSNSSRFNSVMNATKPANAYSFRNQDSYLNKIAATNSSRTLGSTSLKSAQNKLNNSKIAANRATSLKQAAFSKAGIAPNTRASQARMAISQQRAASVSSRGGYSSGGRGFSSGS